MRQYVASKLFFLFFFIFTSNTEGYRKKKQRTLEVTTILSQVTYRRLCERWRVVVDILQSNGRCGRVSQPI